MTVERNDVYIKQRVDGGAPVSVRLCLKMIPDSPTDTRHNLVRVHVAEQMFQPLMAVVQLKTNWSS